MKNLLKRPLYPQGAFGADALFLVASSVIQNLGILLVQFILARKLGPTEFGRFSFFLSLLATYWLVGTAGLVQYLPAIARRRMAKNEGPPLSEPVWATGLVLVVSLLHLSAYTLGLFDGFQTRIGDLHIAIPAILIPSCFLNSLLAVYVGFSRTRLFFGINVLLEIVKIGIMGGLLLTGSLDVMRLAIAWGCAYLAAAVVVGIGYASWSKRERAGFKLGWAWSSNQTKALFYLLPSASLILLPKIIVLLTGRAFAAHQTARIAIAAIMASLFPLVFFPYQTAILSHCQDRSQSDGMRNFVLSNIRWLGLWIAVLFGLTCGAGYAGVPRLFGESYRAMGPIVAAFAFVFVMESPRILLDAIWMARRRALTLTLLEFAKWAGTAFVFLVPTNYGIFSKLVLVGLICGTVNLVKAGRLAVRRA